MYRARDTRLDRVVAIKVLPSNLFAWTVNEKASMFRLADWGVDGIISDKTELLVRTLKPGYAPDAGGAKDKPLRGTTRNGKLHRRD